MNIFETIQPGSDEDIAEATIRRERRREREFYKYYEPICALGTVTPTLVNLYDPQVRAKHIPRSSPDRALTAFCQLGALRLAARRCLLFFFDTENAYILAEATRTLSLVDDKVHEDLDGLWLGNTVVPKSITVCQNTVNIPDANYGSNRHDANAGQVHIINNLAENTRYCDRPFVTEGPHARFYAGVPITTPSGYRIGAFCVLDEKPRDGLSDKDITFLNQMAETVMNHIETIRSRAEFSRGSQMLTSMESFFSSAPAVAAAARKSSLLPAQEQRGSEEAQTTTLSPVPENKPGEYFATKLGDDDAGSGAQTANIASPIDGTVDADITPTLKNAPRISPAADELDVALEHNIKSTFQTAATLIRSAADIDGITFVKLADKAQQTLNGAARLSRGTESDIDSEGYHTSTDGGPTTDTDREEQVKAAKTCSVLGSSLHEQRMPADPHLDKIPAKLLRSLLRRYPHGKIWYFDSEGDTEIGDSSSDHVAAAPSVDSSPRSSTFRSSSKRHRLSRSKESKDIAQLFPGVRALGLVSMQDGKGRTYAAGIIWTYSPIRILTAGADLGFLRAFSDVIMSNVARIQARMEDQAKSDFISSISHELRSPLHGILGSIDFLQEQEQVDQTIVTQIERCSITLMDVIEHLLEFSKISNLSQVSSNAGKGSRVQAWLDHSTQISDRVQSLPRLTEEIADATFYSHCCNLEAKDHGNVAFILDVASEHLEDFQVPVGAWKRLCINIINNALKYTTAGHVSVSLKASHRSRRRPYAVLTVTDTGCGMSRDFLENHLFKAFAQEDSLANGTGLGMSLVAKLVRNMHGKIEVQSTKHVGTTIKISIPTDIKDTIAKPPTPLPLGGLRIRLPSPSKETDAIKRNDRTLQRTALERMCKVIGAESVQENPDITLLLESDLALALSNDELKQSLTAKAAIILCTSFASSATLRHSALPGALNCFVDTISQPYGPERLVESVRRCLIALEAQGATPLASMVRNMEKLKLAKPDEEPERVEEYNANAYISPLRQGQGRGRTSRKSSSRPFFNTLDSTGGSDETATADNPSAISPGSAQSILATPSTTDQVSDVVTPAKETAPILKGARRPLSLMIVDDNRINVRILMTYADRNKHPRITASNGLEAVEAYQAAAMPAEAGIDDASDRVSKPEVIFMDINMPVCDGFEASRRIRAFEKSNGITPATIIALTGLGSADAHQQALTSGVDVFLTKPIRPRELTPLLESIADGRKENNEKQ